MDCNLFFKRRFVGEDYFFNSHGILSAPLLDDLTFKEIVNESLEI